MYKFLHTRVRVSDLDRSIDWYCDNLGFKVFRRVKHIAHLELPGNEHTFELKSTPDYDLNVQEDLMHICIAVPDLTTLCDELEKKGIEVWPDDWREKFANSKRKMAFITDPDNYEVELVEMQQK